MTKKPAPRGRNEQLGRILQIIRDLDRLDGVDLYELAERHGTSVRNVRRDLDAIEAAGLPLDEAGSLDGKRKRWRIAYRDRLEKLAGLLDVSHYLALRVAMGEMGAGKQKSALFATLEDLADKIATAIGPTGRERLIAVEQAFHSRDTFAYAQTAPEYFWPLVDAIAARRLCRVTYRAARVKPEDKSYDVLPLKLFVHDRALYLLASQPKWNSVMTLNLQRLRDLKVLDRTGTPPKDFDIERWEQTAFELVAAGPLVTYRLRFEPETAVYIRERIWHPGQKLTELDDGGVELEFSCAETYEVAIWVASWRDGVQVLAPKTLRKELKELGEWLVETY